MILRYSLRSALGCAYLILMAITDYAFKLSKKTANRTSKMKKRILIGATIAVTLLIAGYLVISSNSASSAQIERAERSCLQWIPELENLTGARVYETQSRGDKIMVQISGRSSRLDGNFVYSCVFDTNTNGMVRLGALDNSW